MPAYDVESWHAIAVRAPASVVYEAARTLDLSSSRIARSLFRVRGLPPSALSADGLARLRFKPLIEDPPHGFALGIVGEFWKPSGRLLDFDPAAFTNLQPRGCAKAIWSFDVSALSPSESRLRTVTRVACPDPASRRRFLLYWRAIRPFSGLIRREALRVARRTAELAWPSAAADIDHLLYGAPDLQTGMDAVERLLGVRPTEGGRHPAYGTRNALVALGSTCYLEVIAPDPEQPANPRGIGFGLGGLTEPRLVTWAVRHPEIEAAAKLANLGPLETGRRERPDGAVLSWRLSDPYADRMGGVIPFLIDWGDTPHPAASAPFGGRLARLRLEHPSPGRVRATLEKLSVDMDVSPGDIPRLVATIQTAEGTVDLT